MRLFGDNPLRFVCRTTDKTSGPSGTSGAQGSQYDDGLHPRPEPWASSRAIRRQVPAVFEVLDGSVSFWMALEFLQTLVVSVVAGAIGGYASYRIQERKLQKEYGLQDSAERVAREMLSDATWSLRSFKVIRHHLGGFEDEELRKILVRCGAIRFMSKSGEELWGLIDRNRDRLGITRLDADPANRNDDDLFGSQRESKG